MWGNLHVGAVDYTDPGLDPIVPKALPANANIALISPSSRIYNLVPDALARSINLLTSLGYRVTTVFFNDGEDADVVVADGKPIAASIANRLAELRAAFSDPSFDAVLCTVGGPTMTELIPSLVEDAELHRLVRENPKILIGYSDITVLHWSLRALTGLRTFYGPCPVSELGEAATSTPESLASFASRNAAPATAASTRTDDGYLQDFHLVSLLAALSRPQPLGTVPRSKFYAPVGRLFGGCLTIVARTQGIPRITPDWKGRILFLESAMAEGDLSKGNPLGKVRQAVADIAAHGVFDEIAGLVIGRPYGYDSERARAEYAAVFRGLLCRGRLAEHQFPILMNVDIGHTAPMVTLPMDSLALLDSDRDEFAITEAAVI
ncbi:peptidase U61 LD-carboxypeptidase A protein [Colletotrichum sojae]|uniref:Peptidase U61 LD-carboxypeptidase A protein n=1 Tax=Colletotrichum sojae TaxID=2175907 RepID=A0A8H6JK20_9PEZI|nr:peptidase U61 LD-carboxypeptidase A protein [Colletotrichum sojae]